MIKISLDTNAVLDFCYRTYPKHLFPTLWENLQISKHVASCRFYLCSSAHNEINEQIDTFGFDIADYENFLEEFKVLIINRDDIGANIDEIQEHIALYPFAQNARYVTQPTVDVDVIATAHYLSGHLITAEYGQAGFKWDINNTKRINNLKIPNVCDLLGIHCSNWVKLFEMLSVDV